MTTRRLIALGAPLVVAAGLVRLAAASNEFWLDEVWSLFIALDAKSAWRLFTVRHDNNHILNTLYLRAIGLTDDQQRVHLLERTGSEWRVVREWPVTECSHTELMTRLGPHDEPATLVELMRLAAGPG